MYHTTRRPGEFLVLQTSDGDIVIEVQRHPGIGARLAIDAPREVKIVPGEKTRQS